MGKKPREAPDGLPDAPPSKSARKREAHSLQALGERLAHLSKEQRGRLPLSPELAVALADYLRFTSHEARRRQMQYIGRLMRDEDRSAIEQALADDK